ncbi:unnamed protein product [Rodentolepis nana]|uniref:F-box domain-containing protein n=1 Tax=Rodentolepis nana TaxID=102285 RepID=A0A0R3TF24_RODNA|nr:unnamed protein product [Rodentolepis nana]
MDEGKPEKTPIDSLFSMEHLKYLGPPSDPVKMATARDFSRKHELIRFFRTWRQTVKSIVEMEGADVRHKMADIHCSEQISKKVFLTWRNYSRKRKQNIQGSNINFVVYMQKASSQSHVKQSGDWFPELPDRILRMIFSYLVPVDYVSCAMVNQAWKIAVDFNASASELDLSKIANRRWPIKACIVSYKID